ncbi:AlpA family phage regulatory protein [Aliifodinibius sp. S!AR15-10]|uniref:helix-turn-helix transcriptional regulator n=1 Tax=Aliifodinibius sp. S!AR15-10 TaxID=2950437 RepID=UPI0028556497|nr:AlpA family phage regulatory protein [Aliifodinibius sp. S!AR15-10]MDR8389511.1 AlpA family phage regulatory protein [Aliifodinibius sp. S!AR15-10]
MDIETYLTETIEQAVRKVIREELEDFKQEVVHAINSKSWNVTESGNKPESRIVRPKELANMLSMSIATIYRMQNEDNLPPKIKMGSRAVGWLRSDIEEWLISRKQD